MFDFFSGDITAGVGAMKFGPCLDSFSMPKNNGFTGFVSEVRVLLLLYQLHPMAKISYKHQATKIGKYSLALKCSMRNIYISGDFLEMY